MTGLIIPSDWDGVSYQTYKIIWPDSERWGELLRGSLSGFYMAEVWDANTGDADEAASVGYDLIGLNTINGRFPGLLVEGGAGNMFYNGALPQLWINQTVLNMGETAIGQAAISVTQQRAGYIHITGTLSYLVNAGAISNIQIRMQQGQTGQYTNWFYVTWGMEQGQRVQIPFHLKAPSHGGQGQEYFFYPSVYLGGPGGGITFNGSGYGEGFNNLQSWVEVD